MVVYFLIVENKSKVIFKLKSRMHIWITLLHQVCLWQIFFPRLYFIFSCSWQCISEWKSLILLMASLLVFSFIDNAFVIISKMFSPNPGSSYHLSQQAHSQVLLRWTKNLHFHKNLHAWTYTNNTNVLWQLNG